MEMDITNLTIKSFHEGLIEKKFRAFDVVGEFFKHIDVHDKTIGAYLSVAKDEALRQAETADIAVAEGHKVGPLMGVPIAIKDNMLVAGHPATAGSKILKNYKGVYDATVIKKLKNAGAVLMGKTNLDEFAMGSSTENSAFQKTKNPHDTTRVPGGSSGGSAAAVSVHMALGSLGSDTGGSIRQPAGFCGVVGLKPTYGAVSRYGLIAMSSSLDQIGPFAKTVEDAAYLFKTIAGHDEYDATSAKTNYGDELLRPDTKKIKEMTVGIPSEYFIEGLEIEVKEAMDEVIAKIKSLGLKIKHITLPHTKYALSCYYIIMPAEVSSNLARFDGVRYGLVDGVLREEYKNLLELYKANRSAGFGPEAKRRIILGTFVLSSGYYDAYYSKAQKVRALIAQDFQEAFNDVDIILTPVSPTRAFKFGEKTDDPLAMYLSDIFTIPVNLAGLPAISIPVKKYDSRPATRLTVGQACLPAGRMRDQRSSHDLPIGFQLIGKHFHESDILGLGMMYEELGKV